MLCSRCGFYSEEEGAVCPSCGEILSSGARKPEGAEMIRQGKRAREAARQPKSREAQKHEGGTPASGEEGPGEAEALREEGGHRRRGSAVNASTMELPVIHDYREDEAETPEDDEPGGYARRRTAVYDESDALESQAKAYTARVEENRKNRRHLVNWVRVLFIAAVAVFLVGLGGWFYLTRADSGQRIMARLGQKATSAALWAVGEERLDQGDITGAIECFEQAQKQDEADGVVDVDGLLMLGNAYEAAGETEAAASLYEKIYTETPSRPEAYTSHIRILRASGREEDLAHAGELMKIAYTNTGDESFDRERSELIPAPPEVDLTAGYYETKKYIAITSYQGYDVYYTFDEKAELPSGGTLFTERVFLDEGIHSLRAVAVNGKLVSDELRGTYKIIMPSPQTPRCNLAPGTYKSRQRVKLKPGKDNENDSDIMIYYTVDGSIPDSDSPVYNGDAVLLPTGSKVTIKAIAVNQYRKLSNMLEVSYKIEVKPYPLSPWTPEETIGDLLLNQTTMMAFQTQYGEGTLTEEGPRDGFDSDCRVYTYDWGYAVMNRQKKAWVLVELYFKDRTTFHAPRETGVGDSLDFVIQKHRDLGQVESASGNRGLYANDHGDGKIYLQEDKSRIVRFRYKNEGHWWVLDYLVSPEGLVTGVDYRYIP